eukprot:jgi/Undpi1/1169/HiC_scaffold_10.g04631.m1
MVSAVAQQAAGIGLGSQPTAKIGISNLAKRRRKNGRVGAKTKTMLAGVVGVALVAVMCSGGGHKETHPILRRFLENSNSAAVRAMEGDVHDSCADPKRWLNSAGHDLLSVLPGFQQHNASMLWGTYRPGVYFGFKTRTFPVAITGGLMWHGGDGRAGVEALRHECSEGDGLGPYGWVEHDGVSYGKQEVVDNRAGVRLVTSMVKPAQLVGHDHDVDGDSGVHLASRVEVFPIEAERKVSGSPSRTSTIYLYVGLDHVAAHKEKEQESGGLVIVDPESKPRRSLLVTGVHPELGGFEVDATAVSTRGKTSLSDEGLEGSGDGAPEGEVVAVNFLGKEKVRIEGVKEEVERLHAVHRRARRKGGQREKAAVASPFLLPDEVDTGSNVVLVQVTGQAPFSVDFVVRASPEKSQERSSAAGGEAPHPSGMVSDWLATGSRSFSDRFRETFSLEAKGFVHEDVEAAKAALSNMLGGLGYFTGRTEVKGAGRSGRSEYSFEARLFTGVPSRSFFPRGFLWDEGFHQLLVNAWDRSTSVDVLGHWLSLLHVHDGGAGEGAGEETGCVGGWLPREQILGEEARKRVPAEFMAQDITVANPPTLLLLVDKLLRDLPISDNSHSDDADAEVCVLGTSGRTESPPGCSEAGEGGRGDVGEMEAFLIKAYPALDLWMRWLLVTQRPGAEGWGGQTKAPLGAFQWRGRDPGDDRLNALTLASGLDDFPRASHPSKYQEWHVDVLSWLALGCRVMHSLSGVVGADSSLPYGELYDELVGGMFDLHWDGEEEAFFDHGVHTADGEVIDQVIMRCQNGYVSLFPLLLKLLPPDSPAVGSLLAQMRDSAQLWSPHGLRSLSVSDPLYQVENNPGDEPYWRGHIWVNVNYLALAALYHYSQAEGPFR